MFQVGDTLTHAAFLKALGSTHGYDGRVEAWYNGAKIEEIVFASGAVKVNARSRERRSLDLIVPERLWPSLPGDPLSPFGVWLRAFVTVTASATVFPEVPVFTGPLLNVKRARWSGQLAVEAKDPFKQINREAFELVRRVPAGTLNTAAIRALIMEVFEQAAVIDLTGSQTVLPVSTAWDAGPGSRGTAIDGLGGAIGAEVFALPAAVWPGGMFVIRPVPSDADPVAWVLPDGTASIVPADEMSQSSEAVVNRWIVTSEGNDAPPIRVPVTDDNPGSPTRYGGPMGRLPGFYSSGLIGSQSQAQIAGAAKLVRSIGLARARAVEVPANPALEGGDVLAIGVDGEPAVNYISDEFTVPLTYETAAMKIDTRSAVEL